MKVAIVHDWLYGGGAERVVLELHRMFPEAPIYTSYCSDEWRRKLDGRVVTGFLQKEPFASLRKYVGILRIFWFMSLDFSKYDLVISSTGNGEAKSIRAGRRQKSWTNEWQILRGKRPKEPPLHICYCHTPVHYYWRFYEQYLREPGFGAFDPLARVGLKLLVGPLRAWDKHSAQRPDYFIANSTHIQSDIKRYYGRESTVIFPPVDVGRFYHENSLPRHGFVTSGRQVPQKHVDIIVKACTELSLPLTVVGGGPEHNRLRKLAGPTINFIPKHLASDDAVNRALQSAEAFIFAAYDDFGITPIEAMASGTPVIAYRKGGALDYIIPGKTGEFFSSQTSKSLIHALENFDPKAYNSQAITREAANYSKAVFIEHMHHSVLNLPI
jgi:glycosyltransferase involved in cell wall biosynthesis